MRIEFEHNTDHIVADVDTIHADYVKLLSVLQTYGTSGGRMEVLREIERHCPEYAKILKTIAREKAKEAGNG